MSPNEFAELFDLVLGGWPTQRAKLNDTDIAAMTWMYGAGLKDLDFATAKRAITRIARTSKFIPTIAEIREAAGIVVHGHLSTGVEAWGPVHRAIRTRGSHRTPGVDFSFEDPITARVVSALGWLDLCASDHDAMPHFRARFIDAYEKIAADERKDMQASTGMASGPMTLEERRYDTVSFEKRDPLAIAPPDERSRMLREVLEESRTNRQRPLGDFVTTLIPKQQRLQDMGDYSDQGANQQRCACAGLHPSMVDQDSGRCLNCGLPREDAELDADDVH